MWAYNYDENGSWKTDVIIKYKGKFSPTAAGLFNRISPPQLSSLESTIRKDLRMLCRVLGFHYATTSDAGLREKLRRIYVRYLASGDFNSLKNAKLSTKFCVFKVRKYI